MTRKVSIALLVVLLFQTFTSSLTLPSQAITTADKSIFKNISIVDEEGNPVDDETIPGSNVEVSIDWSVADLEVEAGSTETTKLDTGIVLEQEQSGELLFEEQQVGEFTASSDNTVTINLNEAIEEYPKASGDFVISAVTSDQQQLANTEEEVVESKEATTDDEVSDEKDNTANVKTEETIEEATGTSTFATSDVEAFADLGNIFTFDYLKINDEDITDGDIIEINEDTLAQLGFIWDTEGLNAQAGDKAEIALSDVFEMVNSPSQSIMVDGTDVGTYSIDNGVLKFEFNENIENDDVHNGFVDLGLEFNLNKFKENIEQEIEFNDREDHSLTVIAKPNGDISGIDKEGHPDSQNDAREIKWTVDVINTNEEEITNATLTDSLPAGLGEARDFVIHELTLGYDGDKTVGEEVLPGSESVAEDEFEVELGTIAPYTGYRIQYTTTIEDYSKDSFTNDASFNYGGESLPAQATVDGLTRSNPIEKSGWQVGDEDKIRWQIDINKNGSLINDAIVEDSLPDGLTVDSESIEIVRITQNGDSWSEGDAFEDEFTAFPIELGELGQEDAYRIKFETDVDWGEVEEGIYQKENGFLNTATLFDGTDELNDDDATVTIDRDPVLRKVGRSNVNYDDKTVTWTIHVNEARHPVGEAVLTDLIPEGLEISEDDIVITDENNEAFIPDDITLDPNADDGTEVVIDLGYVGTKQLTVTYTTNITDFTINSFDNGVGMTGDGIGVDGEHGNATINPIGNSYTKSFAGIDYAAKTIDWRLNVNPVREAIDSLVVEDTFPNKGMILLPDTVKVTQSGEPLTEGTDYTLAPRTEDGETGYHKGFIIELQSVALPLDDGQLRVTYQTSYDPQKEVDGKTLDPHVGDGQDRVYINYADFTGQTENGNPITQEDEANTKVREDSWNSGKKEGQLVHDDGEGNLVNGWESGSERKIAWQLYTNYQEQNLGSDVTITDTLAYEGEIDEGSIQVSVYNVNSNGTTEITDEVLASDSYSVDVEGKQFSLTFADGFNVSKRYVIEFTTSVPDISEPHYTNNATVKVGDKEYPYSSTLNYDKHNRFLAKEAVGVDGNSVFTGDEIEWEVNVNESLSNIKEPIITDTISAGLVYVNDSLEIVRLKGTDEIILEEGTDYTLNVSTTADNENVLTIQLNDELEDTLTLRYSTVVTEEDGAVNNAISLDGSAIEEKSVESQELQARVFSSIGGEWAKDRGALRVTKVDSETKEVIENNEEATFVLEFELNGERQQFGEYTTENGVLEVGNLPLRTYYLTEVTAPNGYVLSEEEKEIVVDTGYNNNEENIEEVTFENTKEKVDITGTKVWEGGPKPAIDLQLYRNGEVFEEPQTLEEGSEAYTWSNLDRTDIDGNEYTYTVDEVDVPENYDKTISADGLTVTNTFDAGETSIDVEKVWEDAENQDGIRPASIIVRLFANDESTDKELTLNEANNWKGTFTELPELAQTGKEIDYSIKEYSINEGTEIQGVEGYEITMTGNPSEGFVITNSHTPELIDLNGTKTWNDADNQDGKRPENITIRLLANGEEVDDVELSTESDETFTFTDLPKFANGEEINYTVQEERVADYSTVIDGMDITNSYTPEQTSINVVKNWDDADNQDGIRPDAITVKLLANEEETGQELVLNEANNWQGDFIELDVYADGEMIEYSIEEIAVEGYQTKIAGDPDEGYVITNSHTPELIDLAGTKTWDDADNQDGKRPESITVRLLANGEEVDNVEATAETDWEFAFTDLPKFVNGEEINYTVQEKGVADYSTTIDGMDITNSYTPEQTSINVVKNWNDAADQDGIRPDAITVKLLADGEETDQELTLNEANNWQGDFTELDVYADGEVIDYSIEEVAVEGYETVIVGNPDEGYVITNSHTPELINLTGTKTWDDVDNQDGKRPESITIRLLANGEEVDDVELTTESDETFTFTDLPKFANGEEINYTVQEDGVVDYSTTIDGMNITNSYTPEQTSINVVKNWNDAADQDGLRPDAITVKLLADEEETGQELVLNEANNWQGDFTELDVYANGETIDYSIEEVSVEGYQTSIAGDPEKGYVITNSHTPELIDLSGKKSWDDANNQDGKRPDLITVRLLANGEEVDDVELTTEIDETFTFTDLPKFANGEEINYTVQEDYVEGYSVAIDGLDITNSYTPEQKSINVVKSWNDANNKEARPDSITVNLLANGNEVDSVELNASNNWQADFEALDIYTGGEEIDYTVKEEEVHGFVSTVEVKDKNSVIIVNSPKKVSVGDYVWFDKNKDGLQDDTDIPIQGVVLTLEDEDGNPVTDVYGNPVEPTTTDEKGWYTFDNLPIDNTYIVRIDREASAKALEGYEPTLNKVGNDVAIDSSTWFATSRYLTEDEERDPTLDFGFVREKSEESTNPEDSADSENTSNEELPDTATGTFNLLAIGLGLLALGIVSMIVYKRRKLS
ncbi:Cna B-type domain-containing protein [Gracilibacillus massiliensis]|uniref:Cna B-type domain-containing protein n=1 Tax=Gracilibacillus massiliensis TaxID=1564956 RepID=UPI00071DE80C|nr:Cna B-type domain-containing protein [Gracilibacillus massiliensis]